ncbi:hypothetical protein FB550_12021 [Neobacillus bataviensis]|uniref:Uncharacterized protein n=1 Tax=Neobacillus bataviensis TaxID=220685 RepID=A0A561CLV3_9BACI|nr:hypothetical protein FB550_12021 [Neobacillus bataviensis]
MSVAEKAFLICGANDQTLGQVIFHLSFDVSNSLTIFSTSGFYNLISLFLT